MIQTKNLARTLLSVFTSREGKTVLAAIQIIDNGRYTIEYYAKGKEWSRSPRHLVNSSLEYLDFFRLAAFSLVKDSQVTLSAKQGKKGGVPVYIVSDKQHRTTTHLRVVFDVSNRALRSFDAIYDDGTIINLVISDRKFNAPLPDSTFEWKAPRGTRKVPR